jgi:hypothetical protein
MRLPLLLVLSSLLAQSAFAQAPVEDARQRDDTLQHGQQRAGAAYRELQQAEYASRLAEQDYRNADNAYQAAQKQANDVKRQADTAKKTLEAAKAKEAKARQAYEQMLNAVSQGAQPPQK